MPANKRYKDSVFSLLFGNPEALRELYEAIAGIKIPPDIPITINTLEGVFYKTCRNDLSFEVGGKLVVLIEHQSTINPNMAARMFTYSGRVYESLTAGRNLYGRKQLVLPRPEFIVLYNGTEPYPDTGTLKLSALFADASALGIPVERNPALELEVKVYNINEGKNAEMVCRSETLAGYSAFVGKVREFTAEAARGRRLTELADAEKDEAMKRAIGWCIENKVLTPFFLKHGSEVKNMLFDEWKLEDALVVEREEGREEGLERGLEIGLERGLERGWEEKEVVDVTNLFDFGMEPEQISRALKLPLETVLRYQSR